MEAEFVNFPFMVDLPKRERSKIAQVWDVLDDLCMLQKQNGPVLPVGVVADALGVGKQRVRDIIRDGRLRSIVMDGRHYIPESSLREFAQLERKNGRPLRVDREIVKGVHGLKAVRAVFPRKSRD